MIKAALLGVAALTATACALIDQFHSLEAGDCVRGNIHVEGDLRTIDCADFNPGEGHHRVQSVYDDGGGDCPFGSIGIQDDDRVVCFTQ